MKASLVKFLKNFQNLLFVLLFVIIVYKSIIQIDYNKLIQKLSDGFIDLSLKSGYEIT